jgi:hypothetical protein
MAISKLGLVLCSGTIFAASAALAQEATLGLPTGNGRTTVKVMQAPPDPSAPDQKIVNEFNKARRLAEKDLRKIKLKHFGPIKKTEIRQAGLLKLRQFAGAPALSAMVTVMADEEADVRGTVLDHLADQKNAEADAALAWVAVYDTSKAFRAEALDRVSRRTRELGSVPLTAQSVVASGLASGKAPIATAAAQMAGALKIFEAIPMMAAAQAGPSGGYYGGQPDSPDQSLAYILVGTQRTFVADLTPVVGESAVGFDPQIGTITEGVVLRVINAFVFEYNADIHNALVGMTSDAWGQSTAGLGWDAKAWNDWYSKQFVPFLAAKKAAEKEGGEVKKDAAKRVSQPLAEAA